MYTFPFSTHLCLVVVSFALKTMFMIDRLPKLNAHSTQQQTRKDDDSTKKNTGTQFSMWTKRFNIIHTMTTRQDSFYEHPNDKLS
jgi:hypothetical protein